MLTPSDAVMMECKLGIESALSIFTMTWMSAFRPEGEIMEISCKRNKNETGRIETNLPTKKDSNEN